MKKQLLRFVHLTCGLLFVSACSDNSSSPDLAATRIKQTQSQVYQPGGDITVKRLDTKTFINPGAHLSTREQLDFWSGFSFFRDPWVIAPASTTARDGLGPLFNSRSCITCHHDGGRGPEAAEGISRPSALLMRIGPTRHYDISYDENYGEQIQVRAISRLDNRISKTLLPEAEVRLEYQLIQGRFGDGEPYELRKPLWSIVNLNYGPLTPGMGISARYAPNIFGMGLLDAIKDRDLLDLEDVDDNNNDGISGKYNWAKNLITGEKDIGKFGFKAKHPSLDQQVAAAFHGDIGITSNWFAKETCTERQTACQTAAKLGGHGDQPEISDEILNLVIEFNKHLGVPPVRNYDKPEVQRGKQLFNQIGCQGCHQPDYITDSDYPDKRFANQHIWPYTDLALHDMGDGLADGVHEAYANGREWRTPPLWGIGLQQTILGKTRLLHDGRARNITEAILWHGGEAMEARNHFKQLKKQDRQYLLAFLEAI